MGPGRDRPVCRRATCLTKVLQPAAQTSCRLTPMITCSWSGAYQASHRRHCGQGSASQTTVVRFLRHLAYRATSQHELVAMHKMTQLKLRRLILWAGCPRRCRRGGFSNDSSTSCWRIKAQESVTGKASPPIVTSSRKASHCKGGHAPSAARARRRTPECKGQAEGAAGCTCPRSWTRRHQVGDRVCCWCVGHWAVRSVLEVLACIAK